MAYNREKTLAIVTGIVCALIFAAGTLLGSYHAIITIGVFAGALATACYLIGDIAIAWAAFIDYHEDGNAMEWGAWGVKYVLSFYLLFSGGCIAYMLFNDGATQTGRTATMKRASEAQQSCLKSAAAAFNGKPLTNSAQAACRKIYEAQLGAENAADSEKEGKRVKWVDDFTGFPLFNYIPGILGLCGLLLLTFVSKLSKSGQSGQSHNYSQGQSGNYSQGQSGTVRQPVRQAPLRAPTRSGAKLQAVTNGNGFFISFAANGGGQSVRFRERGSNAKHVVWVTQADAEGLALLPYDSLAREVMKRREARHGQDSLYQRIAQSAV